MKYLSGAGTQYFYNKIKAKFSTKEETNAVDKKFGTIKRIEVVTSLPSSPEANVLYLITE